MSVPRVLVVGLGGLGCPASLALARSGNVALRLIDDDIVSTSNLHRQILFRDRDVGRRKVAVAAATLRDSFDVEVEPVEMRVTPNTIDVALDGIDAVVDGTDNHGSKFLLADACRQRKVPIAHAGVIGWEGWALLTGSREHEGCLRCLFEAPPSGPSATCATSGVIGSVVGTLGSAQAALLLQFFDRETRNNFVTYDGLRDRLRERHVGPRDACCGARTC